MPLFKQSVNKKLIKAVIIALRTYPERLDEYSAYMYHLRCKMNNKDVVIRIDIGATVPTVYLLTINDVPLTLNPYYKRKIYRLVNKSIKQGKKLNKKQAVSKLYNEILVS